MKTIKIFAFPTHGTLERTSGVDFARIIQPMKALNGYSDGTTKFEVDVFDVKADAENKTPRDWLKVAKNYDVIYFNYLNNPWGFAAMGAMARAHGTKLVLELDDALWNVKEDNTAYSVYRKGSEALNNFTSICNEVDYMTATNDYLKHVIMNNTKKRAHQIKVFPNYVDLKGLYTHRSPFKNDGSIQLMHFGSTTHFNDLMEREFMKGVDRIMAEYPNVTLRFVGAFIPEFRKRWGARYDNAFGHVDIYGWVNGPFRKFMDEADILITPLTEDIYNKCKSNIKFLEGSSAKKPGVWQRIRQYEEIVKDGKNGFLAGKDTEWYKAIKALIDDPVLRQRMGEEAFTTVEDEHQIQDHLQDYADFFKMVCV